MRCVRTAASTITAEVSDCRGVVRTELSTPEDYGARGQIGIMTSISLLLPSVERSVCQVVSRGGRGPLDAASEIGAT